MRTISYLRRTRASTSEYWRAAALPVRSGPYLYTTIRNLASTWGAKSRDVQVDDIADYEDPSTIDDPVAIALDRTLTARAFRSLPERWQSVLWYTEVEGMDPHEVAPILGMSANGVAALSYRAREGLRKAWLQAHVSEPGVSEACKWTIVAPRRQRPPQPHPARAGEAQRPPEDLHQVRDRQRGGRRGRLPPRHGAAADHARGGRRRHPSRQPHPRRRSATTAAAAGALPAVPASITAVAAPAAFAPAITTSLALGSATGISALVGTAAVVAAIGGSVVLGLGGVGAGSGASAHGTAPSPSSASSSSSPDLGSALRVNNGSKSGLVGDLLIGVTGGDGSRRRSVSPER